MIKVVGKRGSWFARAGKEDLPCVHKEWFKSGNPHNYYYDEGAKPGEKKWDELIDAIKQKKRVILTNDRWENGNFERTGYIAIYDVDSITVRQCRHSLKP